MENGILKPGENPEVFERAEAMDVSHVFDKPHEDIVQPKEDKTDGRQVATKIRIELNKKGLPIPADIDAAYRVAEMAFKGGAFPKWVKSAIQACAISQFLRALNLEPMTGIQHVYEINGRLTLWGEGPLAAVRASGQMEWIRETFFDRDYNEISFTNKNLHVPLYGSVTIIKRKGAEKPVERWFTEDDENVVLKGIPAIWKSHKRIMYKRKARAEAIKDEFGDVLAGATIAEYDFNTAPDLDPSIGEPTLAEKLNSEPKALQ